MTELYYVIEKLIMSLRFNLIEGELEMVTRKDIAERANVSVSVVSRALNNSGYVTAEKKKKILQIAEELGYHPNPVAMSLMKQRTKQILFYCRELENAFNIELYEGMLEAAQQQGYMVVIHGNLDFKSVRSLMVDGIILPNEAITEVYLKDIGKNYYLPVVTASYGNSFSFYKSVPIIECNLWEGMRMALQYLWDKGHRKIAMVMPYDIGNENARTLAWREFMRYEIDSGLEQYYFGINKIGLLNDSRVMSFREEENSDNIAIPEDFFGKGSLAAEIFQERNTDATAVICFNDEMALGFCKQLRRLGYSIPKDLSVMGIDGIYSRRYMDILLTTLTLHAKKQGMRCVEVLLDIINGRKTKYVTHIPMKILEGESVRDLRR